MTASQLFAGDSGRPGPNHCYYCGAGCDNSFLLCDVISSSFTNRDLVKYPDSGYACAGCAMSTANSMDYLDMLDGTRKIAGQDGVTARGLAPRMYSWLITQNKRLAFTKAHIEVIRGIMLDPPEPPFAIALSDSGQKQLIFRAPIAFDRTKYPIMLEDEAVDVDVDILRRYLDIAAGVSLKIGKMVLKEPVSMPIMIQAKKQGVGLFLLKEWEQIQFTPMGRLSAWLAPPKKKEAKK